MKRVLVTGPGGFIGRQALRPLVERGYEVHAVDRIPAAVEVPGVAWHQADLLAQDPLPLLGTVRPTHLLHLAWYTEPGRYWTSPENLRWLEASLRLLGGFARAGGRRVVSAGTCAEYDWRYGLCSEALTPSAPATLYGSCKNALRIAQEAFARQEGLRSAWGRVFFLYGPHEHPDRFVAYLVRSLLRGETAGLTHGNQVRDFLHVADVGRAFAALLDAEVEGTVNIASGVPVTLGALARLAGEMTGRPDLVRLGVKEPPPGEPQVLLASTDRLFGEAGFAPSFDLGSGLADTIDWWKRELGRA